MALLRTLARTMIEPSSLKSLETLLKASVPWSRGQRTVYSSTSTATDPSGRHHDVATEVVDSEAVSPPLVDGQDPGMIVLKKKEWTNLSRRTGILAIKLGMTQLWEKNGVSVATTVLQVIDNQVVAMRTKDKEGYYAIQVGAINHPKPKNMLKPVLGQFEKAGVPPKRKLMEFRVTEDALLPVGLELSAAHFVPGQLVDVCSKSIGKGFQGVMKRHHMKGQPATHGTTKTHRKMGATGGGQEPGRIWKGKKMPGNMGGKRVTSKCRKVYRVNHRFNVIYVKGPVPGHKNTYVRITDARAKPNFMQAPFPTFIPDPEHPLSEEVYADEIHSPHDGTIVFPDKRKKRK